MGWRLSCSGLVHIRGVEIGRGVNAIRVGGTEFLLTVTAGEAVHLSREAGPGEAGRGAVPRSSLRSRRGNAGVRWRGYDQAALGEPRWAEVTLCGRTWITMAGGDAAEPGVDEDSVPSCRRCLAVMDKHFPEPELDDRFALVVQVITDTVAEHGYAEMWHVPGDQQAALRKQVRSAVKKRTGYGAQTLVRDSMIVFICDPVYQQHAEERARAAAKAMNGVLTGEQASSLPTPWRLSWDTWAGGR
jgi:hypothetical protein